MTSFPLRDVPRARAENIPHLRKEVAHNLSRDVAYRILDTKSYLDSQKASLFIKHLDKYLEKNPDKTEDILQRIGMMDAKSQADEIITSVAQLQF